ncbi:hypothetical protein BLNAU_19381 [Blattamonas nauphoetae]|uniref:Uncharacterized protein n=1 Tax=Blattamonas nauphoetae TaxID=2049346 RepID=A0ABQ9X1Z0_9EUKA|nr:hypothetical protein BLNAU_19381 [Blattamonas nauphoetae]
MKHRRSPKRRKRRTLPNRPPSPTSLSPSCLGWRSPNSIFGHSRANPATSQSEFRTRRAAPTSLRSSTIHPPQPTPTARQQTTKVPRQPRRASSKRSSTTLRLSTETSARRLSTSLASRSTRPHSATTTSDVLRQTASGRRWRMLCFSFRSAGGTCRLCSRLGRSTAWSDC